jgi:hypothetical protein
VPFATGAQQFVGHPELVVQLVVQAHASVPQLDMAET